MLFCSKGQGQPGRRGALKVQEIGKDRSRLLDHSRRAASPRSGCCCAASRPRRHRGRGHAACGAGNRPPRLRRWRPGRRSSRSRHPGRAEPKTECLDLLRDHIRPAHQDRRCKALVDYHLRGTKNAIVLALGVHDALAARLGRRGEDRLHHRSRCVDEPLKGPSILLDVSPVAVLRRRSPSPLGQRPARPW